MFIPTGDEVQSEDPPTFNTSRCSDFSFRIDDYENTDTFVILVFRGPNGTLLFPICWKEDWEKKDLIENGINQAQKAIKDEDCGTPKDFNPSTCSVIVASDEATILISK